MGLGQMMVGRSGGEIINLTDKFYLVSGPAI